MEQKPTLRILSRRNLVVGGTAAAALAALLGTGRRSAWADEAAPAPAPTDPASAAPVAPPSADLVHSAQFEKALKAILKEATPTIGEPLTLELPELAENGNVVPYKIAVESPMIDTDYVRTLHLLSTSNPQALVASFHLIPASGKAAVAGRMRLARTQDVVAIAERSDDVFLIATRKVEVTIGGCGNE